MAKLHYLMSTSLDGYFEDADGTFDWAAPDEEVHAFVNDVMRPMGAYLYGRRMYDLMVYWETAQDDPGANAVTRDFAAVWQAADKIVYSRTLPAPQTARTRLERAFDPDAVRALKASAPADLAVSGGDLAGQAFAAGLVDEVHLFLTPIVIGGGKRALPDGVRLPLALVEERRFAGGTVYVHYSRA